MKDNHLPKPSKLTANLLAPLHRLFDRLYHSKYNPLYRSGILACFFLLILLVTGIYLIFFYSVPTPYESIEAIQQQFLGRWIRTIHRYATAGVIVAVFFHILQILAQGKTWGPRLIAWISGIVLLGALFLSAWTGYVMVWDTHGQLLVTAGTKMLQTFDFLHDPLAQGFNGTAPIAPSFFFMNLFLHIAIPLLMIFGLWVHTAKLSRNAWFPAKSVSYSILAALGIVSIIWPAPLPPKADLFAMLGETKIDWLSGFWLPIVTNHSSQSGLFFWIIVFILGISVPFWWKPAKEKQLPHSKVNPDECTGCNQCVRDCPFDAITMIPHPDGKKMLAKVAPESCVSCGLCAASCIDLAIGPDGRNGHDLLDAAAKHIEQLTDTVQVIVIGCAKNGHLPKLLQKKVDSDSSLSYFSVNCAGTVHSSVLEMFLEHCAGAITIGCPINNCHNRGGAQLLRERLFDRRVPFLNRKIDRRRVLMLTNTDCETAEVFTALENFQQVACNVSEPKAKMPVERFSFSLAIRQVAASAILFFSLAALSQVNFGKQPTTGLLRVSARVPGKLQAECHAPTAADTSGQLAHMQKLEICESIAIGYTLNATIDGKTVLSKSYKVSKNVRDNRFLLINEDLPVTPGNHLVAIEIVSDVTNEKFPPIAPLSKDISFVAGRISLVTEISGDNPRLELREDTTR